jgi:hypothetical protein
MSCPCLFKSVPAYAQRFLLMMIDKLREEADLLNTFSFRKGKGETLTRHRKADRNTHLGAL